MEQAEHPHQEANLTSLPDSVFIAKVAHPVLALVAGKISQDKFDQRKSEQQELSNPIGFIDLPPAPGCEKGALLTYLTTMNGGCEHQTLYGGCSGCDYHSEKPNVTKNELNQQIDQVFAFINTGIMPDGKRDDKHWQYFQGPEVNLNIIASGSLFSHNEIPVSSREKILNSIREYQKQHPDRKVVFETECRIDDLVLLNPRTGKYEPNNPLLEQLKSLEMPITLGVGIESTNPIVSEGCFNKHLPPMEEILNLSQTLKKDYPQIKLLPHTWLGAPFLSESERIDDTVKSISDCIDNGLTDHEGRALMMVMNRRKLSMLGDAYDKAKQRYPDQDSLSKQVSILPSIWSAGEVIRKIGRDRAKHLMVRGFVASDPSAEIVKPCGQTEQENALYDLVKSWRGTDEEWNTLENIYQNRSLECGHRKDWEETLGTKAQDPDLKESPDLKGRLLKWYNAYLEEFFPGKSATEAMTLGKSIIDLSDVIKYGRVKNPGYHKLD